jgi:hypothetical protein
MPSATQYFRLDDKLRENYYLRGKAERERRAEQIKRNREYYQGEQDRFLESKQGEPDDNIVFNLIAMSVDRAVAFLFPGLPKFEQKPVQPEETDDERWIREVFEYNGGLNFLHEVATSGSIAGHNYVRVIPPITGEAYPRLINIDPSNIITFWREDDRDTVLWHEIYWQEDSVEDVLGGHPNMRLLPLGEEHILEFINIIDKEDVEVSFWLIRHWSRQANSELWELLSEEVWDRPVGPIIQWKHLPNPHSFYGRADTGSIDLQNGINLLLSEQMRINRYHSSPKTILIGVDAADVMETQISGLWAISDPNAKAENLEMRTELQASRALTEFLYNSFLSSQRTVILTGQIADFQRVTNAGVRTVYMDMLSKNESLLGLYVPAIRRIAHVAGLAVDREDINPEVIIRDPLPRDMVEEMTVLEKQISFPVMSLETAAGQIGLSWDTEADKIMQEQKYRRAVLDPLGEDTATEPNDEDLD